MKCNTTLMYLLAGQWCSKQLAKVVVAVKLVWPVWTEEKDTTLLDRENLLYDKDLGKINVKYYIAGKCKEYRGIQAFQRLPTCMRNGCQIESICSSSLHVNGMMNGLLMNTAHWNMLVQSRVLDRPLCTCKRSLCVGCWKQSNSSQTQWHYCDYVGCILRRNSMQIYSREGRSKEWNKKGHSNYKD